MLFDCRFWCVRQVGFQFLWPLLERCLSGLCDSVSVLITSVQVRVSILVLTNTSRDSHLLVCLRVQCVAGVVVLLCVGMSGVPVWSPRSQRCGRGLVRHRVVWLLAMSERERKRENLCLPSVGAHLFSTCIGGTVLFVVARC